MTSICCKDVRLYFIVSCLFWKISAFYEREFLWIFLKLKKLFLMYLYQIEILVWCAEYKKAFGISGLSPRSHFRKFRKCNFMGGYFFSGFFYHILSQYFGIFLPRNEKNAKKTKIKLNEEKDSLPHCRHFKVQESRK